MMLVMNIIVMRMKSQFDLLEKNLGQSKYYFKCTETKRKTIFDQKFVKKIILRIKMSTAYIKRNRIV